MILGSHKRGSRKSVTLILASKSIGTHDNGGSSGSHCSSEALWTARNVRWKMRGHGIGVVPKELRKALLNSAVSCLRPIAIVGSDFSGE